MPESEQSYSTHRRYFPWHHYVVVPVLIVHLVVEIVRFSRDPGAYNAWLIAVAFALVVFAFTSRVMSLRAQDRVIRLEERLRLGQLMPSERDVIDSLKARHLVALRFASDDEVAALARRCAQGELNTGNDIKKEIRQWRPDFLRV
jgi:hypothetical protein